MQCKHCGHVTQAKSKFCANCGKPLKQVSWLFRALLVFAVLGSLYYLLDTLLHDDNTASLTTNINEAIEAVTPTPTSNAPTDRVSLIKDIQQRVFTVVTTNGHGSGFLYAKGGYVVTNAHVVQGEVDVAVRNINGQQFDATVIGISDRYDIALLQVPDYINEEPLTSEEQESPVGLEVIAFGSPQGFENSASIGYITGHNRDFTHGSFTYEQVYQVDAQIDQGSSGGALVDVITGKVIGINSLLYTSETSTNFSFSIPLYSMMPYFNDWIKNPMTREDVLNMAGVHDTYMYEEAIDDYSDDAATDYYDEQDNIGTDEALAGQYVQAFRMYYEQALNDSDFSWVSDMLTGHAYTEMQDYIAEIADNGHIFEFLTNDIIGVTYESGAYYVDTNETFYFYPAAGESQYFERYKTYTVIVDEYNSFQIADIFIHD